MAIKQGEMSDVWAACPVSRHFWAGCVSRWGDKLGHVRSLIRDKINPVFSGCALHFIKVLLKNPSLAVYLLFLMKSHNAEAVLGVSFQCAGDKAFVCRVGNVAECIGEGSGTDLIAPYILSTGL